MRLETLWIVPALATLAGAGATYASTETPLPIQATAEDPDELVDEVLDEYQEITWRSFWNGGSTRGPISTQWNVGGWPTLYLIDAEGVIRQKWVGSPSTEVLDQSIDRLIAKAKGQ